MRTELDEFGFQIVCIALVLIVRIWINEVISIHPNCANEDQFYRGSAAPLTNQNVKKMEHLVVYISEPKNHQGSRNVTFP